MSEQKRVPKRIAQTVLNSLKGGVVPRIGLPYIMVGRRNEVEALLRDVDIISEGGASFRFVVGKYGSGKSFLLQAIRNYVMDRGFIVADADLSPERRLQGTRGQGLDVKSRAILLKGGVVSVDLPRNFPEGMFFVDAPGFSVVNPAGKSTYRYAKTGDGDKATIRCVTGSLSVEGLNFKILSMRAANEVCLQTSQDALFTGIYGTRGDYICKLDQGTVKIHDVETGKSHTEQKFLEWKVSPQTAVRIQRAVPEIGENMAVTVMTFDAAGNLKNRCAFAENRFEVNSGELAPNDKSSQSELEKKAAEATAETTVVETEATDAEAEDDGGGSSGGSSDDDFEL